MARESWSDAELLDVLDKRERLGLSAERIAQIKGVTRNAIVGLLFRINRDADRAEAGSVIVRPENRDGGMPVRWWDRGARDGRG